MESKVKDLFLERNSAFGAELGRMWLENKGKKGFIDTMLYRFYFTFHSQLLMWLVQLKRQVSSLETAEAVQENIHCKIESKYLEHLFNMAYYMGTFERIRGRCMMECNIAIRSQDVSVIFLSSKPLSLLAFLTSLEYLSSVFTPFLRECTRGTNSVVQQYVLLHDETYREQASRLFARLIFEAGLRETNSAYGVAGAEVREGIETAHRVLKEIFRLIEVYPEP
jgi:hypothetical protein